MANRIPATKSALGHFTSWTMTSWTFRDIIIFEARLFFIYNGQLYFLLRVTTAGDYSPTCASVDADVWLQLSLI